VPAPVDAYGNLIWNETGLVSYWRLGEPSGSAADSKGSNTGTYTGTPTLGVAGIPADVGIDNAVTLNGTTQYVTVPDHATLDQGNGALSWECWVKRSATQGTNQGMMSKGSAGPCLRLTSTNNLAFLQSHVSNIVAASITLTDTASWHHCVATRTSGGTTLLYQDGVDVTGSVTGVTLSNTALPFTIGQDDGDSFLSGSIDEVAIYSVVLTPTQVLAHYYAGLDVQRVRPTADVADGNWLNEAGSNTNLYASIDEVTASDSDYIQSGASPASADIVQVRFGALTDPAVGTGHVVRYRYLKDQTGGDTINLTVTLRQADGTTSVASQGHTNISAVTDGTFTLSSGEADSIPSADYGVGLVLEFAAVTA
jgi:hypothetical protein